MFQWYISGYYGQYIETICETTELQFYNLYSLANNLTIVYKASDGSNPQITGFSYMAGRGKDRDYDLFTF